jgi:hypothetical protein
MAENVTMDSVVVVVDDQMSSDLAGETVILKTGSAMYYGLDAIGTTIWSHLQKPEKVSNIRDALLQEYDVDAERCQQELVALLEKLLAAGLITTSDAK